MSNDSNLIGQVTALLNEPDTRLVAKLHGVLGEERLVAFVHRALDVEASGGMLTLNGHRKRTPGGVLVRLVKEAATPEQLAVWKLGKRCKQATDQGGAMINL